jgi:hypothetical protein
MWPRTLTAWMELFASLRSPIFSETQYIMDAPIPISFGNVKGPETYINPIPIVVPPYTCSATIPDPWFHRAEAADQLEAFFCRNQRVRFQMRRIFMAWSSQKMRRRVVGETDVGTMEPIPTHALMRVYDWNSRAIYQFHYYTIYRQLVGSLRYQSMAISSPRLPKNPYTNLPWSIGQLVAIYDQLHPMMWQHGRRFLDPAAQIFYRSKLCLIAFRKAFHFQLDIDCAHQFFHDPTSEYWDEIYRETLVELFHFLKPQYTNLLQNLILDRSLPKAMLASWDTLLYGFWCFENLNRMVLQNIASDYDLYERARQLIQHTMKYVRVRRLVKKNAVPS